MNQFDATLLQAAVFLPLLAAFLLLFSRTLGSFGVRAVAMAGFALPALIALHLWFYFPQAEVGAGGYAYVTDIDLGLKDLVGISLYFGLNGISLPLFLLAGIVGFAAGVQAIFSKAERLSQYLLLLLLMQSGLLGVFASVDIFFFYFFHELALIPTFIMIGVWGGQNRRVAALEMTIYLTLGAMLSLLGLIYLYGATGWDTSVGFNLIALREYVAVHPISEIVQGNIAALLLIGFGILVSLFPFHSWAPRGYAAAPTAAAMLHAGVLKKFGLYGLVQVAAPLVPVGLIAGGANSWNHWLIWLALGNVILIGCVTMAQRDLKQMIGYSSVMHMGYIFLGIATMSVTGLGGAVMLMVAHGLSVALLFLLSTAIYNRSQTYDMCQMGGLGPKAPVLAGFFVASTMASIGLPGFANFWGELTIFIALWENHPWAVVPAVLGVVISAIYGLRAAARIFFGQPTGAFKAVLDKGEPVEDIRLGERAPAMVLLAALLLVGLWPRTVSTDIDTELQAQWGVRTKITTTDLITNETIPLADAPVTDGKGRGESRS